MGVTREMKVEEAGIKLLRVPPPAGSYVNSTLIGNYFYISGQGPMLEDGTFAKGKLGQDLTTQQGYEHAKLVGAVLLSIVKAEVHLLANVKRVVKLFGMVNSTPDFTEHPEVINGCSDLFLQVLGDAGKHARSAVGMNSLPRGISVEIEAIFELEPR